MLLDVAVRQRQGPSEGQPAQTVSSRRAQGMEQDPTSDEKRSGRVQRAVREVACPQTVEDTPRRPQQSFPRERLLSWITHGTAELLLF